MSVDREGEQRQRRDRRPDGEARRQLGTDRRDQPAESRHAKGQEGDAAQERAGGGAGQPLRVRGDPRCQVLGLEPGQGDREHERRDPESQRETEQPVHEQVGGEHDDAEPDDQDGDTGGARHSSLGESHAAVSERNGCIGLRGSDL